MDLLIRNLEQDQAGDNQSRDSYAVVCKPLQGGTFVPGQGKVGAAAIDPDLSGHRARTHTVYLCLQQNLMW